MIRAVLFDVGGTLHEVHRDPALETTFCAQVLEKLPQAQPETDAAPADAETAEDDKSEDFWSKDESQLKIKLDPSQAPVGAEEEEEPAEPDYAAFKGVKFSE